MEHLPQGVKDHEDCFAYQCNTENSNPIGVRSAQNVGDECKTNLTFNSGELVSIDLVSPSRLIGSTNGPFLRLSGREGWLFEKKYGDIMMKRIPVSAGLWCFIVDNAPHGIALRSHPVDRMDIRVKDVVYEPMQKIYCDRKVQHPQTGVNFYRVQGTEGWVFDRRPSTSEDGVDTYMLLDENMVETGLFAYECISEGGISIRIAPKVSDGTRTDLSVKNGELISVDVVRKSPFPRLGNGPFLRLTDGSGWLFENKYNQRLMRPLPMREGRWTFRVVNSPAGIGLRRQPIDSQIMCDKDKKYQPGAIVECTHMVQASSGVNFFRVEGTDGWIFDKRAGELMLTLLSEQMSPPSDLLSESKNGQKTGWDPNFVRGVAAAVDGVSELDFNERSRVISFRSASDGARINVYYTTKTVGTALSHPNQGATQLFRRNCTIEELVKIFENPRVHTGKGYKRRRNDSINGDSGVDQIVRTPHGYGMIADQEAELRSALLEVDEEMASMKNKKQNLLKRIRDVDLDRADEAFKMKLKVVARNEELLERERKRKAQQAEAERRARELQAEAERKARELQARTCQVCHRVFQDQHAKQQHYDAVHVIRCDYCYKEFSNTYSLDQHRDALGHW